MQTSWFYNIWRGWQLKSTYIKSQTSDLFDYDNISPNYDNISPKNTSVLFDDT